MADLTASVNPDGGADYTSLNSAEATEQATHTDLVGDNNTMAFNGSSSGSADTTAATITGWTTGAGNGISVNAINSHGGLRDTGYRIVTAAAVLTIAQSFVLIDGVSGKTTNAGNDVFHLNAANIQAVNCLAYDSGRYGYRGDNVTNVGFVNCTAMNCGGGGFWFRDSGFGYNCVAVGNTGAGFLVDNFDTMTLKNCYAGGNSGTDYDVSSGGSLASTTCHAEDGTADTTTAYSTSAGAYFVNVTGGSEDVHTNNVASALRSAGTDLSADGVFPFDYDFEGDTRSNWDVGADEFVGAPPTGSIMNQLQKNNLGSDLYNGSIQ